MMLPRLLSRTPRDHARHASILRPVAMVAAVALLAMAGCGGSKPSYCSDRSTLQSYVKGLTAPTSSSDISALKSQLTTIKSDATSLVDSAKS